ncbi:MAG: hypothetical protein LBG96_18045 [Tannerella sp.]|nr:hypothetical protein [Tannerella sp.]
MALNREFFGFSGDISRTQVGKLKDASSWYISNDFLNALRKEFEDAEINDVVLSVVDNKAPDDDPVKIEVRYPSVTTCSTYVLPRVLLEIGSRLLMEPSTLRSFRSMVGEEFPELSGVSSPRCETVCLAAISHVTNGDDDVKVVSINRNFLRFTCYCPVLSGYPEFPDNTTVSSNSPSLKILPICSETVPFQKYKNRITGR